jgi:hypothetical protein
LRQACSILGVYNYLYYLLYGKEAVTLSNEGWLHSGGDPIAYNWDRIYQPLEDAFDMLTRLSEEPDPPDIGAIFNTLEALYNFIQRTRGDHLRGVHPDSNTWPNALGYTPELNELIGKLPQSALGRAAAHFVRTAGAELSSLRVAHVTHYDDAAHGGLHAYAAAEAEEQGTTKPVTTVRDELPDDNSPQ